MFGFHFGLTRLFAFSREPAQLVVGILLTVFSFGIRLNSVVSIDFTVCGKRFDGMSQTIVLTL